MRSVESELEKAGADFRRIGQALPDRQWDAPPNLGSRRHPVRAIAVAAAVVLLLAIPVALFGGGGEVRVPAAGLDPADVPVSVSGGPVVATAQPSAEGPPYLLLEADGWQMVSYFEGPSPRTLRDSIYEGPDRAHAEVSIWSAAPGDVEQRTETWLGEVATSVRSVTIDGIDAKATNLDSLGERVMVVGGTESYVIEIDYQTPTGLTNADSDNLLSSIHFAGRAAFEQALPAGSVTTASRQAVVSEMLADIPQPPGFDPSQLTRIGDRYHVGAAVVSAVTCGWIERWVDAKERGDTASEAEAIEAMQSSKEWAILAEMDAEGEYPEIIWGYADGMAGDGTVPGSDGIGVQDAARLGIGCTQ
jgi:hypothetical protein